jgi:magnesium-transporting ATPase (P-type)
MNTRSVGNDRALPVWHLLLGALVGIAMCYVFFGILELHRPSHGNSLGMDNLHQLNAARLAAHSLIVIGLFLSIDRQRENYSARSWHRDAFTLDNRAKALTSCLGASISTLAMSLFWSGASLNSTWLPGFAVAVIIGMKVFFRLRY